jgi:hypothetical protein
MIIKTYWIFLCKLKLKFKIFIKKQKFISSQIILKSKLFNLNLKIIKMCQMHYDILITADDMNSLRLCLIWRKLKKKIEGNKLRKQIDEFGLKLLQIHPSIFIIFIFILFAFFPQNQTHHKRSRKAANVNCIIMAPQPACWCVWCWQGKVWCELWISKLHAYTTYDMRGRS